MNNKLYFYTQIDGVNDIPFPSSEEQAILSSYRYSAKRMGGAPSISATLKFPKCLDSLWDDNVYVKFRGEKYHLKNTPSSSYNSSSIVYTHNIELESERAILDTVYFFDVVKKDAETDKAASNSANFSFHGTVEEFAERLNRSMVWSGIGGAMGYRVVVDNDVVLEDKMYESNNQYISAALKAMNDTYKVPYYFIGKEIHIGYADHIISDILKYGVNNSLTSISKNNANKYIVNRITGVGSSRNITYYYPNPTPKGFIALGGESASNYTISDVKKFASKIDLDRSFSYYAAQGNLIGNNSSLRPVFKQAHTSNPIVEVLDTGYNIINIKVNFKARSAGTDQKSKIPLELKSLINSSTHVLATDFIEGTLRAGDDRWPVSASHDYSTSYLSIPESISWTRRDFELDLTFAFYNDIENGAFKIIVRPYSRKDGTQVAYWVDERDISVESALSNKVETTVDIEVSRNAPGDIYIQNTFYHLSKEFYLDEYFAGGNVIYDGNIVSDIISTRDGRIWCGNLESGTYTLSFKYVLPELLTPYNTTVKSKLIPVGKWTYDDNGEPVDIEGGTISTLNGYVEHQNDSLKQVLLERINVQNTLMPSLYRETNGEDRWYNAINGEYKDDDGNDIFFENPYRDVHPREYILTDDEIYPTIKGMTNASGLRIDMFSEFAYDLDDNDEIYPEDYEIAELAGKYKHPYFFGKLRKFDGEHGFNLFDHAIEGQPMTISFTDGKVGGCSFTIGVDEETNKLNLVQVDEYGNLLRDPETGDVLSGYGSGGDQEAQPKQQNTIDNEVWIALKKDIQTFGVIMPNAEHQYYPDINDHFVLLGIDLPQAYVTAAEERLTNEVIKYMSENNSDKFTFQAKLSRIFFQENEELAHLLTENSKVNIEYNGDILGLYVSSYSYNVSENSPLPEVSIDLNDEIKVIRNSFDKTKNDILGIVSQTNNKFQSSLSKSEASIDNAVHVVNKTSEDLVVVSYKVANIADDRQFYTKEHVFIASERETIENEYKEFIVEYQILRDSLGREMRDKDGYIMRVRKATSVYDTYKQAYKSYATALDNVISSKGLANITPEYKKAENSYYVARAELSKAIAVGTKKKIADLDYLKDAFGADNVMDSNGVVLSQLVSVKDADGDVVAGIYGGANENLNNGGFKDRTHGTLMQFAGASSAQDVANAKYRVYEDGTLFANSGVFGGLVKRAMTTLTAENIGDYTEIITKTIGNTMTVCRFLDMARAGSFIVFHDNIDWSGQWNEFELPYYKARTAMPSTPDAWRDLGYMLSLIGSKVVIYFRSGNFNGCCFTMRTVEGEDVNSPYWSESCGLFNLGDVIVATCVDKELNGELVITWEYKKYKTK